MEYIPVNSIKDIDMEKISIRDLNKRYIDRDGFRYATRFNLKTRRVEVIRIVKGKHEAELIRQHIIREKNSDLTKDFTAEEEEGEDEDSDLFQPGKTEEADTPFEEKQPEDKPELPGSDLDVTAFFNEQKFMKECEVDFERVNERLNGILNSIRKSGYYDRNPSELFNEILRDIDVECKLRIDNAINYYKELTAYPRQVTFYMTQLSSERKKKIDALKTDKEKLIRITRWEMQTAFEEIYDYIIKTTVKISNLLSEIPINILKLMPAAAQKSIDDATIACSYLIEQSQAKLEKIKIWRYKYT